MSANGKKTDGSPFENDAVLSESLQQAFLPDSLDAERNELLIEHALARHMGAPRREARDSQVTGPSVPAPDSSQDFGEGTPHEREQAEKLAAALDGTGSHPLAELAEVILSAHAPSAALPSLHEQLVARATNPRLELKPKAIRVWARLAPAIALAAGVALWFGVLRSPNPHSEPTPSSQLVRTRSVSPMFAETLDQPTPTERIDRIYAIRSKELRHNRYALWRVQ